MEVEGCIFSSGNVFECPVTALDLQCGWTGLEVTVMLTDEICWLLSLKHAVSTNVILTAVKGNTDCACSLTSVPSAVCPPEGLHYTSTPRLAFLARMVFPL